MTEIYNGQTNELSPIETIAFPCNGFIQLVPSSHSFLYGLAIDINGTDYTVPIKEPVVHGSELIALPTLPYRVKLLLTSYDGNRSVAVNHIPVTMTNQSAATSVNRDRSVAQVPILLLPKSSNRVNATIYHESPNDLLIDFDDSISSNNYAHRLPAFTLLETEEWKGDVYAITASGSINVIARELTP